ncbi:beta-glucosidase family protein [Paraherbaspirillum soli]|uniref:Beta-glucosidase n=1 Tax=Paraherbaspirillum soli TaxID=631222 RepID=A0ABW0M913_9BURK
MQRRYFSLLIAACAAGLLAACGDGGGNAASAFSADAVANRRAQSLLAQMTLDEKIQMVHGVGMYTSPIAGGAGFIPGIERLGIPDFSTADASSGVNVVNAGATAMPAPLALAASWDGDLARQYGALIGTELRALGFAEGLGAGVNLAREPRNGRTFEYMGEDPLLAGTLSAQRTIGTQQQKVISTIKHLALNNQETNRFTSNSIVDERTMRELYLRAFEVGVKDGQPGNVMCAYNLVNGIKACENPYLMTTVLKNEWGFKGVVQSDWIFAVTDTVRAANAGLDEEQPGSSDDAVGALGLPTYFNQRLKAAIQNGSVPMARLDDMVFRRLRTLYRIGIMDAPPRSGGTIDGASGNALARQVAAQGMVLLKNDAPAGASVGALPLDAAAVKSVVVIGGHADAGVLTGGGSGGSLTQVGNPVPCAQPSAKLPPENLMSACAAYFKSAPLAAIRAKMPNASVTYFDGNDAAAAANAAQNADVALIFATQFTSEHMDLPSLSLPGVASDPANQTYDQNALISAVAARNKRTVVVLENGTAVTMPWLAGVSAVLAAWYPGIQGGAAIADVLFGDVNPSGKLPLSFPVSDSDLPQKQISATDLNVTYSEGLKMGYRWYDAMQIAPLFAFGHGLSYTTFAYSNLQIANDAGGNPTVSFTLKNTGARAGAEVAQIYAQLPLSAGEPPQRLVGWQKVQLAPGESKQLTLVIDNERLAIWDVVGKKWQVRSGDYTLYVGTSSRDGNALKGGLKL